MTQELKSILQFCKTRDKNDPFNMQSMHSTTGIFKSAKYYVGVEQREKFIKGYYKYVFEKKHKSTMLECTFKDSNKPLFEDAYPNANPIKIDIDLKFELTDEERQNKEYKRIYKKDDIKKFISIYLKYLNEYVKIPKDLCVYLQEKEHPTYDQNKDKKKDGIHIIMPGYLVPNVILHKVRKQCIEDEDVQEIFEKYKTCLGIHDIIDEHVIAQSSWFLYGSGKPNDLNYKVTEMYKIQLNKNGIKLISSPIPQNKKLVRELSNVFVSKNIEVKDESYITEEKSGLTLGPVNMQNTISMTMSKISDLQIKKPHSQVFTPEYIVSLLDCISPIRADDYTSWWKIGQSLYNIDCRNFRLWNKFSQKSNKYDCNVCKQYWEQFDKNHIKYSSLHINYLIQLAKTDNPNKLKKINGFLETQIIEEILNEFKCNNSKFGKNQPIGCATFSKKTKKYIDSKRDKFHFISIHNEGQNTTWYTFINHKWEEEKGAVRLKKFIKDTYLERFKKAKKDFNEHIRDSTNKLNEEIDDFSESEDYNEQDIYSDNRTPKKINTDEININITKYEEHLQTCERLINFLESQQKRNELIRDLAIDYDDPIFHKRLDTTTFIFVCANGVLDTKPEYIHFRPGKPEDMMMRSTRTEFKTIEEIFANQAYQDHEINLQDFMDKIFPDQDLQEYVLNILAETLDGVPKRQELFVCEGSGSNGKTVLFGFLQKVFGEYAGKTQPTLLTRKRLDTSTANPEMYDLRGKRIVYCEEPDDGETFKTGILKELTGNDWLTARTLFKHNVTFKPQYKLFISCNDKPDITSTDDGTWRRIKVIPFVSKFVDELDYRLKNKEKYPYIFKKDASVESQFEHWAPIFLSQLFERYKIIAKNNFIYPTPPCVDAAIKDYKNQQNHFATFRLDRMIEVEGEKLTVVDAFEEFREYAKESAFNIKEYNKNTFRTNMERIIGIRATNGANAYWPNWALSESSLQDQPDGENTTENDA